jgi:predicted acetyltransferase
MMLQIKSLDNDASVRYSQYTHMWYVSANIEIGGDGLLSGIASHAESPQLAVEEYFKVITTVPIGYYLVTERGEGRREWLWNGAAFFETGRTK